MRSLRCAPPPPPRRPDRWNYAGDAHRESDGVRHVSRHLGVGLGRLQGALALNRNQRLLFSCN